MIRWSAEDELFQLAERELFTCAVGDVMDKLLLVQFLPPEIRPITNRVFQHVARSTIEYGLDAAEDRTLANLC